MTHFMVTGKYPAGSDLSALLNSVNPSNCETLTINSSQARISTTQGFVCSMSQTVQFVRGLKVIQIFTILFRSLTKLALACEHRAKNGFKPIIECEYLLDKFKHWTIIVSLVLSRNQFKYTRHFCHEFGRLINLGGVWYTKRFGKLSESI